MFVCCVSCLRAIAKDLSVLEIRREEARYRIAIVASAGAGASEGRKAKTFKAPQRRLETAHATQCAGAKRWFQRMMVIV